MSLRGTKRMCGARGDEPSLSKRRRIEQEDALWQLRPVSDLKMSSIYNRSASEAPAELFRKDLISAMKLPDNEPLTSSEYWIVTDTWKQDWERGVQVPVNPDSLPAPKVKIIDNPRPPNFQEFKLPKDKYIHLTRDIHYQPDKHLLSTTPARAEAACSYDLDTSDTAWLKLFNAERARAGALPVTEDQFERVIEELEIRTWDKIQTIMKSEEGLGIEYDENVICDVCRSPDSEDGNEMVFCDSCNICVHQACYGITVIPDGQWLCRPCGDGVRPTCVLCPNQGGAMKCTPTGHKWAHVSCVLWIPEVSIGCAEKMEPITKISSIPASRWSLLCVLCRERKGACIQCSVKTCKTAYHVTCAFKYGLEMRAIIEDENADDGVKLRSYCQKHSVNSKKEKCPGSGSDEEEVKRKRRKDMTSEEKTQARAARLKEIEKEFDKHVSIKDISTNLLDIDQDAIQYIYNYWKIKRRAGKNRPLLPPKSDDTELLTHRQEQADLDKMKMFVQLRQDLERVRNLCYMVSRREKLSRSFFRMREQTFHKQIGVLTSGVTISDAELAAIIEANHGPSIYDRLYSHPNATDHKNDFEVLLSRIAPPESGDERKKERNGLVRRSKSANPYKKHYVNGSRRSGSMYSGLSSEESESEMTRPNRFRGRAIGSSTDDDAKKSISSPKKKVSPKGKGKRSPKKTERKKKKVPPSKALVDSSSDDELIKTTAKKDRSCSKTLQKMENEMTAGKVEQSGTDSDELMPIRSTRNNKFPIDIYTDSSEDGQNIKTDIKVEKDKIDKVDIDKIKTEKSPNGNDSQQSLPRTKAAMKEFIPTQPEKKLNSAEEEKPAPKKRGRKPSNKDKKPPIKNESHYEAKNKENIKLSKQKEHATDLIVPQRQAAKKAFENMRSTTVVKKEEISSLEKQLSIEEIKPNLKLKGKEKEIKEQSNKINKRKSKEPGKEPISYVPQRQAAKKAAAHIKSGLGTKLVSEAEGDKKKDNEKPETSKGSPKKEDETKILQKHSSSSSSNSSSSSYSSSSSSEEEQEKPTIKPTAKAREIKPIIRQQSVFSPPGTRPTVDLPFLDKVSRPLSSTSASSDSDSSKDSDGSGSDSPSPKRPRRRRKGKSISFDLSPRFAPEKKLKTSERGSECGVSSPVVEREESSRHNNACAAMRARTRSITASGNMSDKSDARLRKPSKDDATAPSSDKTSKESSQPSEFPAKERKTNEEINIEIKEEIPSAEILNDTEVKDITTVHNDSSEKIEIKVPDISKFNKTSPKINMDSAKSLMNRRMSVKEIIQREFKSTPEEMLPPVTKMRRLSIQSVANNSIEQNSVAPTKKAFLTDKPVQEEKIDRKSPVRISKNFNDNKDWLPKAPSPTEQLAPVEKPGGDEKYMTEDKSLDFDSTEKSSVKMIAKIQANLNENTMIKSPKTPMDARTMDPIDIEKPMLRNMRKRSVLDPDRKYINQDASHLQGVEISKSAKIPSAVNPYPNRSMFSPQPKENELFEYDLVAIDDGLIHDEIMKPFAAYPEIFFKEDTKEQGVRETLNLVDRLRMQLSSKKVCNENVVHIEQTAGNINKIERDEVNSSNPKAGKKEFISSVTQQNEIVPLDLHDNRPLTNEFPTPNHIGSAISRELLTGNNEIKHKEYEPIPMTSHEKWATLPPPVHVLHNEIHMNNERAYEHANSYNEEIKEPSTVQSDTQSLSEIADSISLSKQSDDSQPISVVDHELDPQNYDNNNSLIHSNCATISSPYVSQDPSKWGESKIASRRSSTSSTGSNGSSSSSVECNQHCTARQIALMPDIDSYPPMPAYSCPVEPSMPLNQYSTYPDASPFVGSMLFTGTTAQISMPSPGSALYPPALAYTSAPLLPPKPPFSLCAAFTSSSQNMAITTAMIASPLPKGIESPRDEIDVSESDKFSIHVVSSPSISTDSFDAANRITNQTSYETNETPVNFHNQDSKSPKSSKFLSKFSVKSPGKSPALSSPRQSDAPKNNKRPLNKRSLRGRGRSKSRGQSVHGFHPLDYVGNSIQSKLVGTVYDFDEEIANDGINLKSLRDRRKSIDLCKSVDDRKSNYSYKDTSQSPHSVSPQQNTKITEFVENIDTKLYTPNQHERIPSPSDQSSSEQSSELAQMHTMLPGPVDMRTYQTSDEPAPVVEDNRKTLMNFESVGGTEQPSTYIDEEIEKQLQNDLKSGTMITPLATPAPEHKEPPKESVVPHMPKVSLSDSRNQLKVKIKGPFLDANYSANNSQPTAAPPSAPVHETNTNSVNTTSNTANTNNVPGSTSLRRMRKKELLRQYWTQSMSIDESANNSATVAPTPVAPSPISRTVITIPKAVASMTSIPTREDYKTVERPVEKKKRKVASGMSRELRHLKVGMKDDTDPSDDVKLSTIAARANKTHKKRGRASKKTNKTNSSPITPKLKIKIGTNVVQQVNEEPTTSLQFRPPKKRPIHTPSLADIRRENMKFRRKVMADFEETEKAKKYKSNKSEKKKKKKGKKADKLQVVNSESDNATKLIIKIKRKKVKDEEPEAGPSAVVAADPDPFEYDPTAPDPLAIDTPSYSEATSAMRKVRASKVSPIRLKLARSPQGSGYVMKEPVEDDTSNSELPVTSSSLPIKINKHCEVR